MYKQNVRSNELLVARSKVPCGPEWGQDIITAVPMRICIEYIPTLTATGVIRRSFPVDEPVQRFQGHGQYPEE